MEEAVELSNYLPLSFKTPKEQEYIEFLWDAFETNYTHGKYMYRGAPSASISTVSPASAWARMEANSRWNLRKVVFISDGTLSDTPSQGKRGPEPLHSD